MKSKKNLVNPAPALQKLVCKRCFYEWFPHRFTDEGVPILPKTCARCRSNYWQEPHKHPRKKKTEGKK